MDKATLAAFEHTKVALTRIAELEQELSEGVCCVELYITTI